MQFLNDPMRAAPLIALGVLVFYAVCAAVFGFRSVVIATARATLWVFDCGRMVAEWNESWRLAEENQLLRELVERLMDERPQPTPEAQP